MVFFTSIATAQNGNSGGNANPNAQIHWNLNGNFADTTKFIGTTNSTDLIFKSNNIEGFRLRQDTSTQFKGNVFLSKLKLPPSPPKDRFLTIDNLGKITSLDKSGLLYSIYKGGSTAFDCVSTGTNVPIPIWRSDATPTYGVLYAGTSCPARVGVGTSTPQTTLDVIGDGYYTGKLSIGATPENPYQLDIKSTLKPVAVHLFSNYPIPITTPVYGFQNVVDNDNIIAYSVTQQATNQDVFRVMGDGHIWATEINVHTSPFPDYVFAKDYKLMQLTTLENYIHTNKHLPDMPTAKEVEKNGVDLGKMNKILVQKVEELTLYFIQLKKTTEQLQQQIDKTSN